MRILLIPAALVFLASAARPDVIDSQPVGFEVRETVDIDAPAARVWDALGRIGDWWKPEHTFSGDSRNLSVELRPGGCLCEKLPDGGGVGHMLVIYVRPGLTARLSGALGPLQGTGAEGHMTWTLKQAGGGTLFTLTYDVGGYVKGGIQTWARPVDGVLGEQAIRLKRYTETGKPD